MTTYIETKLFSITSNSATVKNNGTYLSDLMFQANNFIKNEPDLLNLEVSLIHAEIPVSFYIINEYNNLFRFKLDTDPITTKTIPVGNYNATSLISALNTALNDTNFIITISKITGKLLMTHNKSFIIYNNFQFSIGKQLGFYDNTINNSVGISNPFTLTPPNMLNLLGIKKLNIVSNELMTINHSSEVGSLSLLTSLAIDQPSYGLIIYENKSGIRHNLKVRDINKIDILILDENHDLVNFNNIDWAMLFCFYLTRNIVGGNAPLRPPPVPTATGIAVGGNAPLRPPPVPTATGIAVGGNAVGVKSELLPLRPDRKSELPTTNGIVNKDLTQLNFLNS